MEDLKKLAAVTALNNMLKSSYFDICKLDSVAKMLNIRAAGEPYAILHTMHCMHYNVMPRELRDAIPGLIRDCLDVEPTYQFTLGDVPGTKSITQDKPRGVLRLLGIGS